MTDEHREVKVGWNSFVRQSHRWLSVAFTAAVVFVTATVLLSEAEPAEWVYLLPLGPLGLLGVSGLYLFVLPLVARGPGRGGGA